jgi:hypothetical protein
VDARSPDTPLPGQSKRVDDVLVFRLRDRADGVGDRAAGPRPLGGSAEQIELELGQRPGAPAEVRARVEHTEARARRVHEHTIEARELGRELERVHVHDSELRTEPRRVLLQLTGAAWMLLDRHDLSAGRDELRCLSSRSRAEVEDALAGLCAYRLAGELRPAALRPWSRQASRRLAQGSLRRLVLGPHQRQRVVFARFAPPGLGHPVRVGVLERRLPRRGLGKTGEKPVDSFSQPPHDGVREGDRALEARRADELDALVRRRVRRNRVHVRELVRAEP